MTIFLVFPPLQIFSTGASKDPVEDVFLTHLDIDFPEFRQISASVKGDFRGFGFTESLFFLSLSWRLFA